jgi:hypothetical protein
MSWLISKALMNSLCSQELAVESLVDTCLDGEQFVQSSGNNTQRAYCAPDKMTGFSRLSRFGMTYKPLTENRGEELLMLYREDFHAKTSQLQGGGEALMVKGQECGEKWHGSFTKFSPDSCSWKTHQFSLLEGLEEFSETWPKWGLMRNGECWVQQTLAHHTKGTESGSLEIKRWPTPGASDAIRGTMQNWKPIRPSGQPAQYPLNQALRDITGINGRPNPMFVEWLMGFPILWTDLKPWAMHKSPSAQQPPGES